ncbi:hypothetical protein Lser_V15G37144 [Lactuca serriola]
MPKHAKILKELLTNRKKLEEVSKVVINENFSGAMLNKLPKKLGDPGMLTLPCQFRNLATSYALIDLGASVNLMPYLFFKKLNLPEPRPIRMAIHLPNKMVTFPRGICEDLLVKVDKFVFHADFIVLDMEEDHQVSIILGRPFLNTASAILDIRESKLTLRVGDEPVTFGVDKAMKHSKYSDDTTFLVDVLGELMEEWKEDKSSEFTYNLEDEFDAERDLKETERILEETEYEEIIKSSKKSTRRVEDVKSTSPLENSRSYVKTGHNSTSLLSGLDMFSVQNSDLELKTLPTHLEYAFLEEGNQKPVIISYNLTKSEKEELVKVLKKGKMPSHGKLPILKE